jgi:hypothetical protein
VSRTRVGLQNAGGDDGVAQRSQKSIGQRLWVRVAAKTSLKRALKANVLKTQPLDERRDHND